MVPWAVVMCCVIALVVDDSKHECVQSVYVVVLSTCQATNVGEIQSTASETPPLSPRRKLWGAELFMPSRNPQDWLRNPLGNDMAAVCASTPAMYGSQFSSGRQRRFQHQPSEGVVKDGEEW